MVAMMIERQVPFDRHVFCTHLQLKGKAGNTLVRQTTNVLFQRVLVG